VILSFFGLEVGFMLEPSPAKPPDEAEGVPILSFWLGEPEQALGTDQRTGDS